VDFSGKAQHSLAALLQIIVNAFMPVCRASVRSTEVIVICLAIFSPRLLHDRGIAPLDPPALGPLKAEPFAHRYRINVASITPVFFQPMGQRRPPSSGVRPSPHHQGNA